MLESCCFPTQTKENVNKRIFDGKKGKNVGLNVRLKKIFMKFFVMMKLQLKHHEKKDFITFKKQKNAKDI